jgi:uncharacterized RDD family membrane protein YckC
MRLVAWGCLLTALLHGPGAAHAAANEAALLAHGSAERFWLGRVHEDADRGGASVTDVYARSAGDARWHQVARVEGRAVDAAHRGAQLALLLDTGSWLLVSEDTVATGRPVPGAARLLGLASHGDTLIALARVSDAPPPASAPASSPSSAPSTAPVQDGDRLVILSLGAQGWAEAGALEVPGAVPSSKSDVSLAVVEGTPLVAVREGPKSVRVYRQAAADAAPVATIETANPVSAFKLLGGGPLPVLWTVESGGAARLHWLRRDGVRTLDVPLAVPARVGATAGPVAAAAAFAIEKVRVVYGTGLALSERSFDPLTAQPAGEPAAVTLPRLPVVPALFRWLEPVLTVLLLFTIISSLRRRREMQETMEAAHQLPLAPFGRRLLAGLVDALPLIGTLAVVGAIANRENDPTEYLFHSIEMQAAAMAALLFYLLHTTLSEIFFGRTVGKMVCGLRVVGLDGERPTPAALVTRNLLRLIDLSMMFFPLVLVLYSPLRQRAGDVAAGTLVVLNKQGAEPVTDEPQGEPAGEKAKTAEPLELTD